MKNQRFLVLVLGLAVLASQARAGILFGKKKPKVDPAQRVPELLDLIKTSPDESKRSEAVEELRKYDPAAFPEMVPVLIDALQNDAKTSVRLAAVSTLGKYRPVSQEVGMALEQALAKDSSVRVRLQARQSLLGYHWAGYHTPKNGATPTTKEPPLAMPPAPTPIAAPMLVAPAPLPPPVAAIPGVEPPIIHTLPGPSEGAQRMPVGPSEPTVTPKTRPIVIPTSKPNVQPPLQGPDLGSPD